MKELIIPDKPNDVSWTDDQWKAITAEGRDILVAAAAGSGKTAVLVERIIRKITDKEAPINIDELLIVTFTNAAAAEMRHRIGTALEAEMEKDPSSNHLRRQLTLLNKAPISTLHSFCLEVIRKYYYLIDVDPAFRIADEGELALLREEVLDDFMEEEYGREGNEGFYQLVDTFSSDRSDEELQKMIQTLYDFSQSHPRPDDWLEGLSQMYDESGSGGIDQLPFMESLKFYIGLQLEAAEEMLAECLQMAQMPGGPAPREEMFTVERQTILRLQEALPSWEKLYEEMQKVEFKTLKSYKGEAYDEELKEQSKQLRTEAKKIIEKLKEEYFSHQPASYISSMKEMKELIAALARLVGRFAGKFQAVKREKGIVDFSDLEHLALAILTGEEGGPSEAAQAYQEQFKEIFLDEYQDFNIVQESIIQLVKTGDEENGNVFMVGDVKQSIYRFRQAEPNLFLSKYRRFSTDGQSSGLRIDLSQNFRSRAEVLAGTNFLFKQIMDVKIGEIEYDRQAELVKGAAYPEEKPFPVEVTIIDQEAAGQSEDPDMKDAAQSELEARWIAGKIKDLVESRHPVYDPKTESERPVEYRDIVILLRSMTWAGVIKEEFKRAGIPLHAKVAGGYFQTMEIAVMLSLLKVIDNPYQDIPLASVLRSPIMRCTENDLAVIRLASKSGSYYEAAKAFAASRPEVRYEELHEKVSKFLEQLAEWRSLSRYQALSALVWQLYHDTHFYDFVGGMPGGKQRQANLRALYDRVRQYEETSFRGLFRFLRFVERMQERGEDLGEAGALSEQEDVVRLMTIHASKGLEFPVVFVAGLNRSFNMTDLNKSYLLDKELGIGTKYVNAEKRISYPSLPQLALKRKKRFELLAEEMRVLYVALTRAKEKLFLLGSVKSAAKEAAKWERAARHPDWLLGSAARVSAKSYLDWVGPALVRHLDYTKAEQTRPAVFVDHPSRWSIQTVDAEALQPASLEQAEASGGLLERVQAFEPVPASSSFKEEITARMNWTYEHEAATHLRSKQSVSDLKRMNEIFNEGADNDLARHYQRPVFRRPSFMQTKSMTPAEAGTALHTVMQHVPLQEAPDAAEVGQLLRTLVARELLTEEQAASVDPEKIAFFFRTDIGRELLQAEEIHRETPFNMAIDASEIYPDWKGPEEAVLVQGVIDCLFEKDGKLYLLDYKTDQITGRFPGGMEQARPLLKKRYEVQIQLYAQAVERIWKRKVDYKLLFFFDGGYLLPIE